MNIQTVNLSIFMRLLRSHSINQLKFGCLFQIVIFGILNSIFFSKVINILSELHFFNSTLFEIYFN